MNFIFTKNIGMLLLAIYLIVIGLSTIAALAISGVITGVLALAAGIFILIGRYDEANRSHELRLGGSTGTI